MVAKFAPLFLLTATACLAAQSHPIVRSVHVLKAGQWHADPHNEQSPEQCAKFRLSDKQALAWFKKSTMVNKNVWLEQLDWTQCSADGTLVDKDGNLRNWSMDQSGRAQIQLSSTALIYLSGQALPFTEK